jgi:hypothetical protein
MGYILFFRAVSEGPAGQEGSAVPSHFGGEGLEEVVRAVMPAV